MRRAEKVHIDDRRSKAMSPIFTPENALNEAARVPQLREAERERIEREIGGLEDFHNRPTAYRFQRDFNQRFGGDGGGMTLAKDDDCDSGCW